MPQSGTMQQLADYIAVGDWTATGVLPHDWGAGATVTYSFDGGVGVAEMQAFAAALQLWHDVANISFTPVASGGELSISLAPTGQAVADVSYSYIPGAVRATITAATITIDPGVFGEPQQVGGYGFLTALHEIGHALGLAHPGPYDEGSSNSVTYADDALFAGDTRQNSVMSYFDPTDAPGPPVDYATGGISYYDQSPMMADILAAQALYGANTATRAGDTTYGFNASADVTGDAAANAVFNFRVNPVPVCVIDDCGGTNTLDLSGFSSASSVDLRPGTYSSVGGLSGNLGIAVGTHVDDAVGGTGDDVFTVNADDDVITGGGGSDTVVLAGPRASYTITTGEGGSVVVADRDVSENGTDTLRGISTLRFADGTVAVSQIACFAAGTLIRTARGLVPVEGLRVGDRVVTLSDPAVPWRPVRWVGWRDVRPSRLSDPQAAWPVSIRAGAFGRGRPTRDLRLSPEHAVLWDDVLIPVRLLVNGTTIAPDRRRDRVTYYHVELDAHDVLLADDVPAESWLDTGNRGMFANAPDAAGSLTLSAEAWRDKGCRPLVTGGPPLAAARAALGHGREPTHLAAAGRLVLPVDERGDLLFDVPQGTGWARLRSASGVPAERQPGSPDGRRLGLAVTALELETATRRRAIALDSPALGRGWHALEQGWRWTDGDAVLRLDGAQRLRVQVAAAPDW